MRIIYIIIFCCLNVFGFSQNLEWAKSIGSSDHDWYRDIFVTKNNDIISFGDYTASIDLDPGSGTAMHSNSGGADPFVQRLDANGNYIWSKSWGNGGYGNVILDVAEDKYGNLYFTGSYGGTLDFDPGSGVFNLTSVLYIDYFILKLDSNGNFLWAISMGGSDNDQGTSILVDENLNIYTAGVFSTTVDFDPNVGVSNLTSKGSIDAFIQKLDSSGNLVWVYGYGDWIADGVANLSLDGLGNIYVSGTFTGNVDFDFSLGVDTLNGNYDVYVLKIDTNASFQWVKYFNGPAIEVFATDMKVDKNDNIYLVGGFGYNNMPGGAVVDFDPSNLVLNKMNMGEEDIFEVSLDANGNLRWVNVIGGAYNDRGMGLALDNFGNVFFVGSYEGSVDFDTGPGVDILSTYAVWPGVYTNRLYMHAVDTNGLHQWALYFGGDVGNTANISVNNSDELLLNGSYKGGGGDFDPNSGSAILPSYGLGDDAFILKFNSFPVNVEIQNLNNNFSVYPNPVSDIIYIQSEEKLESIEIIDLSGKKVLVDLSSENEIKVNKLPSGVYILRAIFKTGLLTHKFIKQ